MSKSTLERVFKPFVEGMAVTELTGRPVCDIEGNNDLNDITTLANKISEYAFRQHNMAHIRYSLASDILIPEQLYGAEESKKIKAVLTEVGIIRSKCDSFECNATQKVIDILNGILQVSSEKKYLDMKWPDGRPQRFLFQFEFSSHLIPDGETINQFIANELVYIIANAVVIRNSGNYVLLNDVVEGRIESKVSNILPSISLEYPDYDDKLEFIKVLHRCYPNTRYENGLDDKQIANLLSNTPNRSLEGLFWGSDRTGNLITVEQLIERKVQDVSSISEDTLTLLDVERVKDVELVGATIEVPKKFLMWCAEGLRTKNKLTPMNVILLGAPSTGKTDLALMTAISANVPAYALNSPKNSFVGETERRSKLQMRILTNLSPNISFIDEVTEAYCMERLNSNNDCGASAAVTAALLESLSDKTREGNSILIGTSNCGWKISGAMLSRFTVVPVLMPVVSDYPRILASIAKNISQEALDVSDEKVIHAANIFFVKNLMPRQIRNALKHALSVHKKLGSEEVLWAANDAMPLDYVSRISSCA